MRVARASTPAFVLGVYPTTHGFGWAVFQDPLTLVDHSLFTEVRRRQRVRSVDELDRLLGHFRPETVVVPETDPAKTRRHAYVHELSHALQAIATDRGVDVTVLSREDVLRTLTGSDAATRADLAEAVAARVPALSYRLPKRRRFDDGEARSLAIYDAAALALTFYENGATALLDELRDAA